MATDKLQRGASIEDRYTHIERTVPKYVKVFAFQCAIDIHTKSLELLMHTTNLNSVIRQADEDRKALREKWSIWRPELKGEVVLLSKKITINVMDMMERLSLSIEDQAVQIT